MPGIGFAHGCAADLEEEFAIKSKIVIPQSDLEKLQNVIVRPLKIRISS